MSFIQNIKYTLQKQNALTTLIVINVSLFFVVNISHHIFQLNLIPYLALPLNITEFLFKFWTIITYMFTHENLGHVFYNMLLFYFSSITFTNFLSQKKLVYVYIMSGISGGLTLLILSFIVPVPMYSSYLFGASAAVIGVVMSLATYLPNLPVSLFGIIEMRYKYYALLIFATFTIIDFTVNTGGKISHFGGAFFGLLFGYLLKQGTDISELSFLKKRNSSSNLKIVHSQKNYTGKASPNDQQTIDNLLDKISKSGYESLSETEKQLLFKLSQKK